MGIEKPTTEIGGHTYKLTTFGALQGMSVAMTLVRFLGPTMADFLGASAQVKEGLRKGLLGLSGAETATTVAQVKDAAKDAATGPLAEPMAAVDAALGDMFMKGISTFAATAKPEDFRALVQAFVESCVLVQPLTTKGGGQTQDIQLTLDTWDKHFAGRYRHLIQWLVWCIRQNFSDFFDF